MKLKELFKAASLSLVLSVWGAGAAVSAERAIVVLDGSGSMWAQIDGKPRIAIARETVRKVLQTMPAELELGLIGYGHREKGSCEDIELLVEPQAGAGARIIAAVDAISPKGKTPLSQAVRQAAEQLRYTEEKATVILVTDGLETCAADPCALATELEAAGVDFTTHVVGFGLTDEEGRQVACLAENTGGRYIQASDSEGLAEALTQAVVQAAAPAPEPAAEPEADAEFNFRPKVVMAEGEAPLPDDTGNAWVVHRAKADGSAGEYVSTDYGNAWRGSLEPGDYVVTAKLGEAQIDMPVRIEAGKVVEQQFNLNAGTLKVRPLPQPGGEPAEGAAVNIVHPLGETTGYGETSYVLPAGAQKLKVRIGAAELVETFTLAAGEAIEKDVVVGVGRVVANADYAEGVKVEDSGLAVEVFKAAKKLDGSRESIVYGYGPDTAHELPAGDYVLVARMGAASAEAPFSVKVGELVEPVVMLDAGVAALAAPGAARIEIFEARKSIQGDRKQVSHAYGETLQDTLKAGDYVAIAFTSGDEAQREVPLVVKAGERVELTIELP